MSILILAAGLWPMTGCRRAEVPVVVPDVTAAGIVDNTALFRAVPVGLPVDEPPWIAHVRCVDLDQDGLMDLLVCDARNNRVSWIRQYPRGTFTETVLANNIPAPVHVEAADFNRDGHLDVVVSSMGQVFPNNDKIGSIIILENDGQNRFVPHVIADHIARVTDVQIGDLDGDGLPDLAVAQFGYDQGQVQWMKNLGHWKFESHPLLELSGAINVCIADMDGDGKPDLVALFSQQWEEIYLFHNDGRGNFTSKILWGSTNEDYGSSGISICDLNRDGRPDVLYTNGDGFGPAAGPGPRPWHSVQWLENRGKGQFQYHRIGRLPGAYSPVGVDLDGDGKMDVVASSAFADWDGKNPATPSLVWFRNEGHEEFVPHLLATAPKDLVTVTVGPPDDQGRPTLVTGGFYVGPPYERMGRVTLWTR
jgi:hypothetical protein